MGKDKALLAFGSNVLIAHVAVTVLNAAGSVALVGPVEAYRHLDFAVVPDVYPGFGPVGGVVSALSSPFAAEWNLIVACDMPGVSDEFLSSLLSAAVDCSADCTVPKTPDGRIHALCAVYRQTARLPLLRAVQAGIHKLQHAIEDLNVHFQPISAPELLANVNTPDQWKTFQNATH